MRFAAVLPQLLVHILVGMGSTTTCTPGSVPMITLNDGKLHPAMGYGTYKVGFVPASASSAVAAGGAPAAQDEGPTAAECVGTALELGYRFLDCAQFYGNEAEVGKAIKSSGVPRDQLYLASKACVCVLRRE